MLNADRRWILSLIADCVHPFDLHKPLYGYSDEIGGKDDVLLHSLEKSSTRSLCKLQVTTIQPGFKWWGENPEKAPNPARQLRSLGHWWSSVVTG